MNKKASLSLVLLFAVLISACTIQKPTGTENQAGQNPDVVVETEESQSTSLRDLLALGKSQKCVITSSVTDDDGTKTDTSGTIYISGKKMAQEVMVTSTDKEMPKINMRMISDGDYMYTWNTETKAQGMKIKITEPEKGTAENGNPENGSISMDDKLNVKCSSWLVENSIFSIPSDVQFTDLSEMMKNIPTMPAGLPGSDE